MANISCLAALGEGREPGHQGCTRDPGAGAAKFHPDRVCAFLWLGRGWLRVRYSGVADFQVFLFFVYICMDNYMADLLIARKINFSFKKCQLGH